MTEKVDFGKLIEKGLDCDETTDISYRESAHAIVFRHCRLIPCP